MSKLLIFLLPFASQAFAAPPPQAQNRPQPAAVVQAPPPQVIARPAPQPAPVIINRPPPPPVVNVPVFTRPAAPPTPSPLIVARPVVQQQAPRLAAPAPVIVNKPAPIRTAQQPSQPKPMEPKPSQLQPQPQTQLKPAPTIVKPNLPEPPASNVTVKPPERPIQPHGQTPAPPVVTARPNITAPPNIKAPANHLQHIQAANDAKIAGSPQLSALVQQRRGEFQKNVRPALAQRDATFSRNRDEDRRRFAVWNNRGFCGEGRCFDYHPDYDIDVYYSNPVIYRLFVGAVDAATCELWFGALDCSRYPGLLQPFRYTGMFYPTTEFRDLDVAISGFSIDAQATYEMGLHLLGDRLTALTGAVPAEGSVVVDYSQLLPGNVAVVIEGFAALPDGSNRPFKAFLSLQDSRSNAVFIPSNSDGSELADDVQILEGINSAIRALGGVVDDSTALN